MLPCLISSYYLHEIAMKYGKEAAIVDLVTAMILPVLIPSFLAHKLPDEEVFFKVILTAWTIISTEETDHHWIVKPT